MQTFLPYPDFVCSAIALDNKRLGKQRVECAQILGTLLDLRITTLSVTPRVAGGWKNHPAVVMWRGHESSLRDYAIACCNEWIQRGFNDRFKPVFQLLNIPSTSKPSWIGGQIHSTHRAALLEKERWDLFADDHYKAFGWSDEWDGYFWPK